MHQVWRVGGGGLSDGPIRYFFVSRVRRRGMLSCNLLVGVVMLKGDMMKM